MFTIVITAFGISADMVGGRTISVEVAKGIVMSELLDILTHRYPALCRLSSLAIAVNGEYAQPHTIINHGDEVAIIPPVSGG